MLRARREAPGPGPSLVSGDAYQYQLRHIKQNLDPNNGLASSRAISSLAAAADDAWSLLAVCALSHPLPHAEVLSSGTAFSAWLMEPGQKQPTPASAGRRAGQTPPGTDAGIADSQKIPRRPGRLATAKAQQQQQQRPQQLQQPQQQQQQQSQQPQQPQPPQQPTPQRVGRPEQTEQTEQTVVSDRTQMSRLDLPAHLLAEEANPRQLPAAGKEVLPVVGVEVGGGKEAGGGKEERAVSSTPRDAALPEQEAVAVALCPHCSRSFAAPRLEKHAAVCQQAQARRKATPSKVANGERAEGGKADRTGTPEQKKLERKSSLKWRNESANLRAAMDYNRKLAQAEKAGIDISTLPPPPTPTADDRVECPHCNRKFNADVADRHIPKCNAKKR